MDLIAGVIFVSAIVIHLSEINSGEWLFQQHKKCKSHPDKPYPTYSPAKHPQFNKQHCHPAKHHLLNEDHCL